MRHPVKLSETLVLDARLTGQAVRRSIAGQIEFWANLGRAIEPLLQGTVVRSLCRTGAARKLSECLESVDAVEGRQRLSRYLHTQPYPHYKPAPGTTGLLVRIEADGKRAAGRFVNRKFVVIKTAKTS